MADDNTPKLPSGGNSNVSKTPNAGNSNTSKLPAGNNSNKNPLAQKELDVLDPEAKAKSNEKKGIQDVVNDVKDKVDKARKTIETIGKIIAKLGPLGCLIVLIIIIIIGIIGFLTSIPGLMMNKLKAFAQEVIDSVQSWFLTDADAHINPDAVVELANYLEEMDYDLVGYGFITPKTETNSSYLTYDEVIADGYIYYEIKEGDTSPRYYNDSGIAYDGYYYNSLGILIDNSTGQMVTDRTYIDQYGLERSTENIASNGQGQIVSLGEVDDTLLRSYLLSDYRIYGLRNSDETILKNIFSTIKSYFGGYDSAWAKGLLKFYYAENGIAKRSWNEDIVSQITGGNIDLGDSISISGTKLTLKNGYFNNPVEFDIDGWADRYGMSLEFLLSLHLATMQPDLVYAMLQSFDTEVQVYLNDSGEAASEAGYVDLLDDSKTTSDMITWDKVTTTLNEAKDAGVINALQEELLTNDDCVNWIDSLAITKKVAQYLLKNLELTSPSNCTGAAQLETIVKSTYGTGDLSTYNITEDIDSEVYDDVSGYTDTNYSFITDDGDPENFEISGITLSVGTDDETWLSDDKELSTFTTDATQSYGYSDDKANISDSEELSLETSVATHSGGNNYYSSTTTSYSIKRFKKVRTWMATVTNEDGSTEEVEFEWVTYKYLVYRIGTTSSTNGFVDSEDEESEWVDTIIVEWISRDKTDAELIEAGIMNEDGTLDTDVDLCSEQDWASYKKCCKNCQKYVKSVLKAIAQVEDTDYKAYTPYIARVLGSWFRDTYFIIPEDEDAAIYDYKSEAKRSETEIAMINNSYGSDSNLVIVDEEYLAETDEYWTAYVMKQETDSDGNAVVDADGNAVYTDEYQLYYLNPNGITSDYTLEEFLADPYSCLEDYKSGYAAQLGINSGDKYETQEEAEEAGHAFVKKAQTITAAELSSSEIEGAVWSAYGFDSNGAETGWTKIGINDGNDEVKNVYEQIGGEEAVVNTDDGGFYYNITSTNNVTQVEDAQRSETNSTVKYLFKYRKFYTYDGTTETAELIAADKEAVLEAVESYLKSKYGTAKSVALQLGTYGRSALRQTYLSLSDDEIWTAVEVATSILPGGAIGVAAAVVSEFSYSWEDVTEEWLTWQLDMYYSGVTNGYTGITLEDIKWSDYGLDEERDYGDPRNPDLIGTTDITKTSLTAFSILESTKTLAAEYAYRDFKELIVELDYFDKEDLSDKVDSVFTWVLSELSPTGWPVRPYDKQNNDYGALIESAGTYDYLEESDYEVTDEESEETEEAESEETTEEETETTSSTIDESKIFYIGDSWIEGLRDSGVAASDTSYFDGLNSTNAGDHDGNISLPSDVSCVVVEFGLNGTSLYGETQDLITELMSNNSGLIVYVLRTSHVASGYGGSEEAATNLNNGVDSYNEQMKSFCSSTENCYYIDPTQNIVENSGEGFLKDEYKMGGGTNEGEYHLSTPDGYQQWYNDIIAAINGTSSSSTTVTFEGYEGGELVSSPVTGKVIEYGTHIRTNVYTEEEEEVGYIVIEALSSESFTSSMVSSNSGDSEISDEAISDLDGVSDESISSEEDYIAAALNLFSEEYEDVCSGYTIIIDGIDVDLNLTDDSGNNGAYEQNEVETLYNSDEQTKREIIEQAKDDAPFFVNVDGTETIGNLPDEYYSSSDSESAGIYIKEGKYIGTTLTDDEAAALTVTTSDSETEEEVNTEITEEAETEEAESTTDEYTGPANYIRIMVKDTDYSIIDNVEDFFDIPDAEESTTTINGNSDLSAQVEALMAELGITQSSLPSGVNQYWNLIVEYSNKFGLDPYLVRALICQESGGNVNADGAAIGLMQWEKTNGDPNITITDANGNSVTISHGIDELYGNAEIQIEVGCAELKSNLEDMNNNLACTLHGYNAGRYGLYHMISYHISGHTGYTGGAGINPTDEIMSYIESGDIEWLKDDDRQKYRDTYNQSDPLYLEHVLRYYNTNE